MSTLAQIAGEVAREWADGRVAVPPAQDSTDDDAAFWEEVARRVVEVEEAFDPHQPRYPRGHPKAGQWRPKLTTGAGRVAPGHLARDLRSLNYEVRAAEALAASPSHRRLGQIGLEVEKLALRYSARKTYEKRLADVRAERNAIQDRKWEAWESFWRTASAAEIEATQPEDFLTGAEVKRLSAFQDEEVRLLRERDRADRDAYLGVLSEIRPMGGTLREAKDYAVDRASGIETRYVEDHPGEDSRRRMKTDLDAGLKDVVKVIPQAWLEDTNAKGEVSWLFSRDRAYASTSRTEPKRPKDEFRAMEEGVDLALAGKLTDKLVSQAAGELSDIEGDLFPSGARERYRAENRQAAYSDDGPVLTAWRERQAARRERLAAQRYTWVGRTKAHADYPNGLWAVVRGEDDDRDYYLDWGGNLHVTEATQPTGQKSITQQVIRKPRDDRRIHGPVPITQRQHEAILRAQRDGGAYMGMYDNRWPVVRRAGYVEGGVGPYAPIYDWIDDEGGPKNIEVAEVAPPGGFDPAKWDREAPLPPLLPSTTDTIIRINPTDTHTLLHEISHRLESVYGEENRAGYRPIEMATHGFLDSRTQGETVQKLQDLYPGYAYDDHEMAKPDRFVDAYIGKVYPGTTTEVLTMGMEMLWFPRYGDRDINKDPEMRRLMLGMLAAL
jgi:hypothetical protein